MYNLIYEFTILDNKLNRNLDTKDGFFYIVQMVMTNFFI